MRWVHAMALIVAGLFLLLAGGSEVRPASDPAPTRDRYRIEYLDPYESREAELFRILEQHRVCEETGQWDQWPCTPWAPPSLSPHR